MSDPVDRQVAIDELHGKDPSQIWDTADIEVWLNTLPSAQTERKSGEWIRNDNGTYSCSVCQSWIPEEQHCYARYCLYCGADMRGEQDVDDCFYHACERWDDNLGVEKYSERVQNHEQMH